MNGRPLNVTYAGPTWATATNFPAGSDPWNGQPLRVLPPIAYATPGEPMPAEYFNSLLGRACDQISSLQSQVNALLNYVGQLPALNWSKGISVVMAPTAACFDKGSNAWIVAAGTSDGTTNNAKINRSYDGGDLFQPVGTGYGAVTNHFHTQVIAADGAGNYLTSTNVNTSLLTFNYYDGSTWHLATATESTFLGLSDAHFFNNQFVMFGPPNGTQIGLQFATPTSAPTSIVVDGACPAGLANVAKSRTFYSASLNQLLWLPLDTTGTGWGHSIVIANIGSAFAYGTFPLVVGDDLVGCSYDEAAALWVACIINASNVARFLTSPDGLTWTTLATTISLGTGGGGGFTTLDDLWICVGGGSTPGAVLTFYSTDRGITWAAGPGLFNAVSGTFGTIDLFRSASRGQAMIVHAAGVRATLTMGR